MPLGSPSNDSNQDEPPSMAARGEEPDSLELPETSEPVDPLGWLMSELRNFAVGRAALLSTFAFSFIPFALSSMLHAINELYAFAASVFDFDLMLVQSQHDFFRSIISKGYALFMIPWTLFCLLSFARSYRHRVESKGHSALTLLVVFAALFFVAYAVAILASLSSYGH